MPLSQPAAREHLHRRKIDCRGYRRQDGLWDIEAHLTDDKTYATKSALRGDLAPGEAIHDLSLRLTLDGDLVVRAVETASDATPYAACPRATENFQTLVGLRIAAGWNREIIARVGGVRGCTHLRELLGVLATVAFQTIFTLREKELIESGRKPPMLDSCHAWDSAGAVVKAQYPAWYSGD